jgi:hypothetical protein
MSPRSKRFSIGEGSLSSLEGQRAADETEATMGSSRETMGSSRESIEISPSLAARGKANKWHECIESHDWDKLETMLKEFNYKYYKRKREQAKRRTEKQVDSPKRSDIIGPPRPRRRSTRILNFLPQSLSGRMLVDPSEVVSPLMQVDALGRTPLHLACLHKAPETFLLQVLKFERNATSVADRSGQVPLHLALQMRHFDHILDKIIRAHPNALKTKDIQGRTPVGYAVQLARQKQEEDSPEDPEHPFHWGTPLSIEEKSWQFAQENIWSKVDYMLKDLMRRKKAVIPSEHGLILEALEGGAPPKTLNRFISTADTYLGADDDLAGSAISSCLDREYCLDTLEYLLDNCREKTTIITDYTHKALISLYGKGCHSVGPDMPPFGKEVIDWAKHRNNQDDEERETEFLSGISPSCKEWWERLRHFLFYCAYDKSFKENKDVQDPHMLHAALAIPAAQPSLIQMLLIVFPNSRMELCPVYKALPVHIACTRWRYDILRIEKDPSLQRVVKQLLKAKPRQVVRRYRGQLPVHMALNVGQSWAFVKPFVSMDKKALGMRDPHSKMFPFQLAAAILPSTNIAMLLRTSYTPSEWKKTSKHEKKEEFANAEIVQERRQIETIFELLRRHPEAIIGKVLVRDQSKTMNLEGTGPISAHYLSWVYLRGSMGWKLQAINVKILRDSILNGYISKPLEPWWDRLKHLIWETALGDHIPRTEEYLLHTALYNPDTPPLVVELLLQLFPTSAAKPIPGTQIYPLHISAGTTAYHPQSFELPCSKDNMHLTLLAYKRAVQLTAHGRLPLHICIARGKTWKETRPLVRADKATLLIEDPVSGLAPFQLMVAFKATSPENCLRFAAMVEKQTRNVDLNQLSAAERAGILRNINKKHELGVLSSVYELLRNAPAALHTRITHASDAVSVVSSSLSEESDRESKVSGIAAIMEESLQEMQQSPNHDSLRSPEQRKQKSSIVFLNGESGTTSLITPNGGASSSLSKLINGGTGTSMRSLVSRSSGMYDDYVKPNYDDDDLESSMGASATSTVIQSPHSIGDGSMQFTPTPTSSSKRNHIPRMKHLSIKLPDLGIEEY